MAARSAAGQAGPVGTNATIGVPRRATIAAAYCVFCLAWLILRPVGEPLFGSVTNLLQLGGAMLALLLCLCPFPGPAHRRTPLVLSLGIVSGILGQLTWSYYEIILGQPLPLPSWADAFFLAGYPCVLLGILLIPERPLSPMQRLRLTIDSLLVMVAGLTFSWFFLLGPTLLRGVGTPLQKATALAYPLGDLVLVCSLLLLVARTANSRGPGMRLLIGGLLVMVATDSTFLRGTLAGTYVSGGLTDLGWPLAYLLTALGIRAIVCAPRADPELPAQVESAPPLWRTLLPFALLPAVLALSVFARLQGDDTLRTGVVFGTGTLFALTLLRQGVTIAENHRLYRALRTAYTQLEERTEQLALLTTADPLTGLPNHRTLLAALDRELERARRYRQPFALIFLDLDHFKALNDAHGHIVGDLALHEFGEIARGCLRATDTLGRWGGEEFLAILPQTDTAGGLVIAERLRTTVAAHPFATAGLRLTCSLGLATFPDHGEERDQLVAAADSAMYAAKRLGRNQAQLAGSAAVMALLDSAVGREQAAFVGLVTALVGLAGERDDPDGRRTELVGSLVADLALALGCTAEEARLMALAGRLHDIGKVALPDAILQKAGTLAPEEWAQIYRHPVIGAELLERVPALHSLAPLVRGHHERWDGQGYPDGLAGEAIPLGARIVAVAEAYAAMTTDRNHQAARPTREALAELRRCAGSQFDPAVVTALEEVLVTTEVAAVG